MSIDKNAITYAGNLARINLTPQEKELFTRQLNDILSYINKLGELDTKDVNPMIHAVLMGNVLRDDIVKGSLASDEALANAPARNKKFFKVPKVIG